jgi:hypothetical protein
MSFVCLTDMVSYSDGRHIAQATGNTMGGSQHPLQVVAY